MEYTPTEHNLPECLRIVKEKSDYVWVCNCCKRSAVLRPVKLTDKFVRILNSLDRSGKKLKRPVPIDVIKVDATSYTIYKRLKYWDFLVITEEGVSISKTGRDFLEGRISVPERVFVYLDHVRTSPDGEVSKYVTFKEVSKECFSKEKPKEEMIQVTANDQTKLF